MAGMEVNLRTLKKLSKRVAPLLAQLGDRREQFRARRDDNFIGGTMIMDRKHWERGRSVHGAIIRQCEVKWPARDGRGWIWMAPPHHARKGTIMVGAREGYYEPEWEEECAWSAFEKLVMCHFTDWNPAHEGTPKVMRPLRTAPQILAAAREMLAELAVPA